MPCQLARFISFVRTAVNPFADVVGVPAQQAGT
jgi:hypothetical protein